MIQEQTQITNALGAPFGGQHAVDELTGQCLDNIKEKRINITDVGHAATELILTRLCADVSTFTFQMRLNGDNI